MSFNFVENVTIEMPDLDRHLVELSEHEYRKDHGIIVEIAAIHEGMTANFNYYSEEELSNALESWVSPYPKPIIQNHDLKTEAIGRVMAAKMDRDEDGTPFTLLQVAITDSESTTKVLDKRYLTGSVGGKAEHALCSICEADWAEKAGACAHRRGRTYQGQLAYFKFKDISFKEYSIVNLPADSKSHIRAINANAAEASTEEGWVRTAKVFALNLNKQEILEFAESADINILDNLKKREVSPAYMRTKGAFLSALAISEEVEEMESSDKPDAKNVGVKTSNEEFDMTDSTHQEEEDILKISEGLSADLAEMASPEMEEGDSDVETTEEEDAEEAEQADEAEATEEEDTEEAEGKPEGQEVNKQKDVDPEGSAGAPVSREDEEEDVEASEAESAEEGEVVDAEENSDSELNEELVTLESRVEELESENAAYAEKNEELEGKIKALEEKELKLRTLLKQHLAESVVDMKIAMGIAEESERAVTLEEHMQRSAASLADSRRDLAEMPKSRRVTESPKVEEISAVEDEGSATEYTDIPAENEVKLTPEDILVEALMGRRKL